jgi:hypothetical protein
MIDVVLIVVTVATNAAAAAAAAAVIVAPVDAIVMFLVVADAPRLPTCWDPVVDVHSTRS